MLSFIRVDMAAGLCCWSSTAPVMMMNILLIKKKKKYHLLNAFFRFLFIFTVRPCDCKWRQAATDFVSSIGLMKDMSLRKFFVLFVRENTGRVNRILKTVFWFQSNAGHYVCHKLQMHDNISFLQFDFDKTPGLSKVSVPSVSSLFFI